MNTGLIINGRYRIAKLLGEGGFGAVYQAWDLNLNKLCALKMNLDTSPEAQRQFQKEAETLAKLSHPNLPRVTDRFLVQGQGHFLVMDFVEGEDLESVVAREGAIAPEQAIKWVGQVADALNYLHNQPKPIIHRDIKPANIRVTKNGRAVLVDFGLVKVYDEHLKTTIGARAVTPGYSPPEQYGQGNTNAQTDIYALAATLYTLLTGDEPLESIQRLFEDKLQPVGQRNMAVSVETEHAIGQAMSLAPSQRYGTVLEFAAALQDVQEQARVVKKPAQKTKKKKVKKIVPQSNLPTKSSKEIELDQLYKRAKAASSQSDWLLVEELCLKIQAIDITYRTVKVHVLLEQADAEYLAQGIFPQASEDNWGGWIAAFIILAFISLLLYSMFYS